MRRRAPTHQVRQAGEEHPGAERLGDIVIRAEFESVQLVVLAVLGREHDHRNVVTVGSQVLEDAIAGQPWEHDVEDDDVVTSGLREAESTHTVVREVDGVPRAAQSLAEQPGQPDLVLDDENPPAHTRGRGVARRGAGRCHGAHGGAGVVDGPVRATPAPVMVRTRARPRA